MSHKNENLVVLQSKKVGSIEKIEVISAYLPKVQTKIIVTFHFGAPRCCWCSCWCAQNIRVCRSPFLHDLFGSPPFPLTRMIATCRTSVVSPSVSAAHSRGPGRTHEIVLRNPRRPSRNGRHSACSTEDIVLRHIVPVSISILPSSGVRIVPDSWPIPSIAFVSERVSIPVPIQGRLSVNASMPVSR